MSLGKRLFIGGAADDTCTTDTADIFGDSSGIALYSLDYDASDASGNYDGTPSNVTFGELGQINYAGTFNGSTSRINIASNFGGIANIKAISIWFKTTTTSTAMMFNSGATGGNDVYGNISIYISSGIISGGYLTNNGGFLNNSAVTSSSGYNDGNWHNVVLVLTGTYAANQNPTLYVDGVDDGTLVSTALTTVGTVNNASSIGYFPEGNRFYFNGLIDQVRIFNKALSQSEVDTLYAEERCVYDSTTDNNALGGTNLAYYKLDNNADDEKNSYDGTASNVTYEFGRYGAAASFNGSNSKIVLNGGSKMTASLFGNTFSLSYWVQESSTTNGRHFYFNNGNDADYFIVYYHHTNGGIRAGGSEMNTIQGSESFGQNEWYHVVLTVSSTEVNLYVNGVNDVNSVQNVTAFTNDLYVTIGNDYDGSNGTNWHNGLIDQVRIFNTALDQDDVDALYAERQEQITLNSTDPYGDSDLIAYYKFDNNADDALDTYDGLASNVTFDSSDKLFGTHSASFNGGTSSIALSGSTTLTSRSISMWVKPNTLTATSFLFDSMPHNFSANTFGVWGALIGSNGNFVGCAGKWNGSTYAAVHVTDNAIPFNEWTHIVITATGSSIKAYYNGVEQNHDNSSIYAQRATDSVTLSNVRLGDVRTGYATQDTYTLNGRMEQVRIFERALEGDEVFQLYSEAVLDE